MPFEFYVYGGVEYAYVLFTVMHFLLGISFINDLKSVLLMELKVTMDALLGIWSAAGWWVPMQKNNSHVVYSKSGYHNSPSASSFNYILNDKYTSFPQTPKKVFRDDLLFRTERRWDIPQGGLGARCIITSRGHFDWLSSHRLDSQKERTCLI